MAGFRRLMDEPDSAASQGDVYYADASGNIARLAAGTAGHVLTTGGAGADPSWAAGSSGAPTDAQYLTLATNGTLTDERVATAGEGISITDGGAGMAATFKLNITGLTGDDPDLDDEMAIYRSGLGGHRKITVQELGGYVNRQQAGGRLTLASGHAVYNPKCDPGAPSSTDTGAETVTFASAHGLVSGTKVAVDATGGGLTVNTAYYVNAVSSTAISFHTTVANALAGASAVNLTASITASILVLGVANRTLYYTPDESTLISLYDGTRWNLYEFAELSLGISAYTASKNYDIWIYPNAGSPTLDSTVWTDDSTRATALATQDGVDVKSGDTTRRYVGTIRITATTGDCEDSWGWTGAENITANRLVWNRDNQKTLKALTIDLTSHTYNSTTWRQWRANSGNAISVVFGKGGETVFAVLQALMSAGASANPRVGIGYDIATAVRAPIHTQTADGNNVALNHPLAEQPRAGYHTLYPIQSSNSANNATYANMYMYIHMSM